MSIYARLAAILILVAAVGALWWKADRMLAAADARGYERKGQEYEHAAEIQRLANRDRARNAEVIYTPQAQAREKFIVTTIKEIEREAAPLAVCPLPEPVRLRANAAAVCASENRPASCGADESVRQP